MKDIYLARGEKIAAYLEKEKEQLSLFSATSIDVTPRKKYLNADALVKLASTRDVVLLDVVSVEYLAEPSIYPQPGVMELTQEPSWMDPIVAYLKTSEQPKDKTEAHILRLKATCYALYDDKLYRRGYSMPILKYVTPS